LHEVDITFYTSHLNFELFIAKRILREKGHFSNNITGIVVAGIAVSLAVMITAISIVTGFKKEIRDKVIGFGSHIQIINYDSNLSYQTTPVPKDIKFYDDITKIKGIRHVQPFALKAGIIKTKADMQGLVLKGVDSLFDWSFFKNSLIEGKVFNVQDSVLNNKILVSSYIARKMGLKTGNTIQMWFIDERPRFRKFEISGIYETSLAEFDETFAMVDMKHVQRLNNWDTDQVSGFEIFIRDFKDLEQISWEAREIVSSYYFKDGSRLRVMNIVEKYPQIFDWLELQDLNVIIIIVLMLIVAAFNMISGLLILILDRSFMIGILKALGSRNISIRKVFFYKASYLILRGLLWGNIIGLSLCIIQKKFEIISLNPENYYLTTVPINLNFLHLFLINAGAMIIILAFLILPSMLISRISPSKTIRFN
jgi:lipoprotein-releasing system permease protein